MANKPLRTPGKKKQPSAVETSSSIEDKIKSFLKAGGKIEQIKSGASGQQNMPPPKIKAAKPSSTESGPTESSPTEPKKST